MKQYAHLAALHARGHLTETKRQLAAMQRAEPRTSVAVVRDFFKRLDANGMTDRELSGTIGGSRQSITNWRRGVGSPRLSDFENAASAIGYRLVLVPDYPAGDVAGPCICGSWPGGPCLRCPTKENDNDKT